MFHPQGWNQSSSSKGFFLQERPINCPWISWENRWFPVKISHIFWENLWFPVDFSLKPIHCGFNETILKGDGDGLRCSLVPEIKVLSPSQGWNRNDMAMAEIEATFKFMILTTTELPHPELMEHFDLIRVVPNAWCEFLFLQDAGKSFTAAALRSG